MTAFSRQSAECIDARAVQRHVVLRHLRRRMHSLEREVEEERRLGHGVGVDDIDGLARERDRGVFPLVLPRDLRAVGLVAARRRVAVEVVAAGVVREVVLAAGVEAVERVEAAEGWRELVLVEALCANESLRLSTVQLPGGGSGGGGSLGGSHRVPLADGVRAPAAAQEVVRHRRLCRSDARESLAPESMPLLADSSAAAALLTVRRHPVGRAGRDPVVHAVVQRVAPREERHARRATHALHVVCAGTRARVSRRRRRCALCCSGTHTSRARAPRARACPRSSCRSASPARSAPCGSPYRRSPDRLRARRVRERYGAQRSRSRSRSRSGAGSKNSGALSARASHQ